MTALNTIPFVSVANMKRLVRDIGLERFLTELAAYIEEDFRDWEGFDKRPRVPAHSPEGVIELMPTSNGEFYGCKYVSGYPSNTKVGRQTVTAFGVLSDVASGYPILLTEMTLLTALRTAATSAFAARLLAPKGARTMALIGSGAQCDFQAMAFKALLGIGQLRLYDIDHGAMEKVARNLSSLGFDITLCGSAGEAVQGADIITTITADIRNATILSDNMIGEGVHINAVGGDSPGKTELQREILLRANIFVEYPPQTWIEGEIQQLPEDHPITQLWQVVRGEAQGRTDPRQVTLFDSVGFAVEDFAALRYVRDQLAHAPHFEELDFLADPEDPRDLFGLLNAGDDIQGDSAPLRPAS